MIENVPHTFLAGAQAAAEAIAKIDRVLIAAHVNPDGDAVGSMAACGWMLKGLDKTFALYSPSSVPTMLEFLPLPGPIYPFLAALPFKPQAAIYVDCSEDSRLGKELAEHCHAWPAVNIDHHLCEYGLGSLANYIETSAAATCQLVAYIACCLGLTLKDNLATAIGTGLITDTGNFTHNNSSAAVFSLCALLESNGCNLPSIGEALRSDWQLKRMHLWGRLFGSVRQGDDKRIAWCFIEAQTLRETYCTGEDLEGFIDWMRRLKGVEVALTLRQLEAVVDKPEGEYNLKFSLRSKGKINVQRVAAEFGGGGHRNASGGTVGGRPEEILGKILAAIGAELEREA